MIDLAQDRTLVTCKFHTMPDDQQKLDIQMSHEMRGGVWANSARVSHSDHEFTIDFMRIDYSDITPERVPGVVVSRVNLSPLMVTQLQNALSDNWSKYAAKAMPPEVHDDGPAE